MHGVYRLYFTPPIYTMQPTPQVPVAANWPVSPPPVPFALGFGGCGGALGGGTGVGVKVALKRRLEVMFEQAQRRL